MSAPRLLCGHVVTEPSTRTRFLVLRTERHQRRTEVVLGLMDSSRNVMVPRETRVYATVRGWHICGRMRVSVAASEPDGDISAYYGSPRWGAFPSPIVARQEVRS